MNKKYLIVVVVIALLAGVFALTRKLEGDSNQKQPSDAEVVDTTADTAASHETEESRIPGIEYDMFDEDEEDAEDTVVEEWSEEPTGSEEDTKETTSGTTPTESEQKPTETKPAETKPSTNLSAYEQYENMSAAQQREFMESFDSVDAFFDWYNKAKDEHDAQHPDIEIGNGAVDLDKLS